MYLRGLVDEPTKSCFAEFSQWRNLGVGVSSGNDNHKN